jgi:hypothetical protein
MSSETIDQILLMIEHRANSRPSALEFEMAYQARIAIDRIRFAIKHTEQFGPQTDQSRDTSLQLLDALQRLEIVDRQFQERSRAGSVSSMAIAKRARTISNGVRKRSSHEPANGI